LVRAIPKGILQVVKHSKAGAKNRFRTERTPRDTQTGLEKKLCVVCCENRIADVRLRRDDAIRERIIRRTAMSFIPTCREFLPVTERKCESLPEPNDILRIASAEKGPPVQFGGCGVVQEASDGPRQEGGETRECSLSVLAESQSLVGLKRLEPHAQTELMWAARKSRTILKGVQISVDSEIASIVAARQPQLRLRV
jgi:hypothetical protein